MASLVQECLLVRSGETKYDLGDPTQRNDARERIKAKINSCVGNGEDLIDATGLDIELYSQGSDLITTECGRSKPLTKEDLSTLYSLELGVLRCFVPDHY